MKNAIFQVENLSKHFGDFCALNKVSFQIEEGSFFSILGPNGSGKSTLFRILATELAPTSGSVFIAGQSLNSPEIRKHLGVLFQFPSLDKKLTVDENLLFFGKLHGLNSKEVFSQAESYLELLGLNEVRKKRVEYLSGGTKRRVELVKVLLPQPKILLLDEPTTGLDPKIRKEFLEALLQIQKERKMTVLLITHQMEEAEVSDEVMFLDQGKVLAKGTPVSLCQTLNFEVIELETREGFFRLENREGAQIIPKLFEKHGDEIVSFKWAKPTLEDFFFKTTGKSFHADV